MTALASRRKAALRKYRALFRIALEQARHEYAAVLARLALYGVLLVVLSRLWIAIAHSGRATLGDARSYIWYVAVTEVVALGVPYVHLDIEHDVRSGDFAYRLARPLSYLVARVTETLGSVVIRWVSLVIAALVLATPLAGGLPEHPLRLFVAFPMAGLAAVTSTLFLALIGMSAFWTQDTSPAYWVWQKLLFLCGGLLLPLDLYPDWARRISEATPFAALLYGPGHLVFVCDGRAAAMVAVNLAGWSVVAVCALWLVERRALATVEVNGG